jgi:TIR domain
MNVFISYSLEDGEFARKLISRLAKAGLEVWDAAAQVGPGDNWALKTGKALEKSDAMIVLISPASAKSHTVQKEIEYALTKERFQDRLIPVVVKPTTKYPWILEHMQMLRGEPAEVSKRILSRLKKAA